MLALAAALSLIIGLVLGLLGGGGSILTTPMLVYVLGIAPQPAFATTLLVVAVTSGIGVLLHRREGRVHGRIGLVMGAAGMVGAFGGGWFAHLFNGRVLLVLFGLVVVITATAMLRSRRGASEGGTPASFPKLAALGLAVGGVAGLIGAGGGFLIVPALVLFGGLSMEHAIGTSLLVLTLQAAAGFAGHVGHVTLDGTLVTIVTLASVVGAVVGARLAGRIAPATLRRGFGVLVLAIGLLILVKELSGLRHA